MADTIFALSSGGLPSGVAIIRLSGAAAFDVAQSFTGRLPTHQSVKLLKLIDPTNQSLLDEGLVLAFSAPNSFTGEDVVEFHCHGGVATVDAVLQALGQIETCRLAEPGEFSRRAFENGRLDLTELEGLADLISAQTENQRKQALNQSSGALRSLYDSWRSDLIRCRALIEAELDFSDEDDIPGSVSDQVWASVDTLKKAIENHLEDERVGEIIREGFVIALTGPPNAGKSSLLNALAKRDVAIVTPQAGTTRDTIEVSLNIEGQLVTVVDTAGIRETSDIVEKEGIRRALEVAEHADLTLWLNPIDSDAEETPPKKAIAVATKADLDSALLVNERLTASTELDGGLDDLLQFIIGKLASYIPDPEQAPVTRQRHRLALKDCLVELSGALKDDLALEMRSERLRLAADCLGRLTGRIDVEDLLDVIFSEFCVGK